MSGLCPGPAVVSLASGQPGVLVFVASMLAGIALHRAADRRPQRAASPVCEE